jgi:hypothetical protein
MVTTGQLRILVKDFLGQITNSEIISSDDIRWLKSGNGIFPRKLIWAGVIGNSEFKETPYTPEDTFILFDILQEKNIATERIGDRVISMLPFKLVVNVYGKNAEDQVQYMLGSLHTYYTRLWLTSNKISLKWEPDEFQILDGRENASWWIRRRFELFFNTEQNLEYVSGFSDGDEINSVDYNRIIIREGGE